MNHEAVLGLLLDEVWTAAKGPGEKNLWLRGQKSQTAEIIKEPRTGSGRRFTLHTEWDGSHLALQDYPGQRDMYFEVMEVVFHEGSIAKLEVHTVADAGERAFKVVDYTNGRKRVTATRGARNMSPELREELLTEGKFMAFTDAPDEIDVGQTVSRFLEQIKSLDFSTPKLV